MSLLTRSEATWPQSQSDSVPALAGFVVSAFSPLAAHIAARCLEQVTATERTAVIIVSATGDLETAEATAKAVDAGQRPGPLLFYQAVPNAVAGYIAAKHGLAGPVICLGPQRPGLDEGLAVADLLIRDGDADEALIISVEQAMVPGGTGNAIAVLVKGGN
ncbi:beta-ketoacyl synthase chain length factor [Catelliglobosispora koreensis]|uniref:beta-ketoacyl synthase chain length factor n=1 Tax=Catelliglobosispora koreensis TaxID=129052 RepID=UPI000367B108|nr:beta-ketoacyl synthase chain length factor [Catelliglobosispora koreensis]